MSKNFPNNQMREEPYIDGFSQRLQLELEALKRSENFRSLKPIVPAGKLLYYEGKTYLNFSSNDYLGLSCSKFYHDFLKEELLPRLENEEFLLSNPASRLMTGNSHHYTVLEEALGTAFHGKSALVLSSGFMVNSALLPCLARKGDLILADKLVHASIIDGLRIGEAEWKRFRHNDLAHLEALLKEAAGRNVWVVTESIFSMDGDLAPLKELVALKKRYAFKLYLDEAHAFGVRGKTGLGLAEECGVLDECDILIATFGKALASTGAFIISDFLIRDYLINKLRTLIFSTAIPPINLMWTAMLVKKLPEFESRREHLRSLQATFTSETGILASSQIIPIPAGTNERALELTELGRSQGFWLTPIRHPTVPAGTARIRISLSATMEQDDILKLCQLCSSIRS